MSSKVPFDPSMAAFDHDYLWHPYSPSRDNSNTYPVVAAAGCLLELADGRQLIDGMSSWWAAIHGYNHPVLNAALTQQAGRMAHVMFGGLTHPPAVALGQRLHALLPQKLRRIFYCDSGSVAVEVAVKMALQYQFARGQAQRKRFVALEYGYHGDTFAAMSLCDPVNGMHHMFKDTLPQQLFVRAPQCGDTADEAAHNSIKQRLAEHHDHIAAVILEPVVQGAGGMRIYAPQYLDYVQDLCNEYDVLLILDEIATGFGRSGEMFAFEHAQRCIPDILCVGKSLTAGYMSMAATITSDAVADTIDSGEPGLLAHGPTYMGNPLACAVAAANIDLLKASGWRKRIKALERRLQTELGDLKTLPGVSDVRVKGAIGAVETTDPVPRTFCDAFVARGVWIRPFRNLVYIMPPYTISDAQLSQLCGAIKEVIRENYR